MIEIVYSSSVLVEPWMFLNFRKWNCKLLRLIRAEAVFAHEISGHM